jgi:hypothetical protein
VTTRIEDAEGTGDMILRTRAGAECGVRGAECGAECGVRGAECGAGCGVRCAVRCAECGVRRLALSLVIVSALCFGACRSSVAIQSLRLDGNRLTITNDTSDDWTEVDVRLNTYYHFPIRAIPAGGRYQVGLDSFVAGYGQRFDFRRAQIRDLRLSGRRPDGQVVERQIAFEKGGLAGALEGLGGKR